ncbi:MAG: T9SS type A sorting domain-containing protein [Ignavibacteriae bacterium]|nr:T9SS type A sorting domain-containing protein [Ignavibacteriota bacterium]MCB9206354.1 T9SS type A sorting domain-containing protein [Ignavibacteriales bacterium]MCB9218351.1 T9SS type A sorting domain-containing protein [Ignavibacteriales bacterium]MCB9260647.1 T9SS type A sorting domain-containing protein [Ignavibacteriales bacterium]
MHHINKLLFIILFLSSGFIFSQEVGDILWEDHFDDTATDPAMHLDVGWFYYDENDGLSGAVVQQVDGKGFLQTGNFANFVGAVVASSNGVPFLDPEDEEATHKALIEENKGQPNQEITFNINFKSITNSFVALSTRLVQRDTSESLPDSDPTHEGSYVLFFSPLTNDITLSRVLGDPEGGDEGGAEYDFLNPAQWQHFGATQDFELEQNVNYWVKYYLYEGDMKMKIWEGDLTDEPAEWLLEGTDPSPRVTGSFTMFSIISADPSVTDQIEIDDVVVRIVGDPVAVDETLSNIPSSFDLKNNYPNPFNPTTNIEFSLVKSDLTTLKVYSITGELVRTLVNSELNAGSYNYVFNGRNDNGQELSSGMYIYELVSGANISAKKMFLIK